MVKAYILFLLTACISFCRPHKEMTDMYTASTPAADAVRQFLGISFTDSIDFIRWKLVLQGNQYELSCNYGISKPNTNGFINGGNKVTLAGKTRKDQHTFQLQHKDQTVSLAIINSNLLHVMDAAGKLLAGNAGWSYTLNRTNPVITDAMNGTAIATMVNDSLVFEGRTPCQVPGIVRNGVECYKLKWRIVFQTDAANKHTGRYKVIGTPWRIEGGRTGHWETSTGKDGRIVYRLKDESSNSFLDLVKPGENILLFMDQQGRLLVGNEDFSYTLNRVQ